jgi:FkbM family methyltransferase
MNRQAAERVLLKTVRAYTFNTPIAKGKYRAFVTALKFCRSLPEKLIAETRDGRRFSVHFETGMQASVYFLGEYEKNLTEIATALLRKGDTCLDVGANFGWYTSLFHSVCGSGAHVHAFEPMPPTFVELAQNYELMGKPPNVRINDLALGDRPDESNIHLFPNLPTGHASISDQGRSDAVSYKCHVITLDSYLDANSVGDVRFVKADIEGSELMFLTGASRLFEQRSPPIMLMEMALEQTKNFGYRPNDLIEFLRQRADYDFYRIHPIESKLSKIEGFSNDDIGANVICYPRQAYPERFQSLQTYL